MSNIDLGKQISGEVSAALAALSSIGPLVARLTDAVPVGGVPGSVEVDGILSKFMREPFPASQFVDIVVGTTTVKGKISSAFALETLVGRHVSLVYVPRAPGFAYDNVISLAVKFQ